VRSSLVLALLLGLASPALAKEGPPPKLLQKVRAAERGDRLGVWESSDHLREGRLEAGYSANTDNIIVSLDEGGARTIWILSGPGLEAHSVITIRHHGDITVHSNKSASEEAWRRFLHAIGEKSAMHRKIAVSRG